MLYDSGWTAGTADSYAVPYTLTSLSGYTVQVSCRSAQGAEGSGSVSFLVELPSTAADPEPEVGRVYEIGINGVGYMLADDGPEGAVAYQRRVVSLDPPRLATSDTPFAQAVERYTFAAQTDWSGGAGQVTAGRESSRANAFYDSDGVWPFDPGKLSLLPDVALSSHTYAQLATTVVGSTLHVLTGAKQLTPYASVGAPGTAFTVHASAGTVTDVTTATETSTEQTTIACTTDYDLSPEQPGPGCITTTTTSTTTSEATYVTYTTTTTVTTLSTTGS